MLGSIVRLIRRFAPPSPLQGRWDFQLRPVALFHHWYRLGAKSLQSGNQSMRTLGLFPTPVIVAEIGNGPDLCPALKTAILAHEARTEGVTRSNLGGWQSRRDFFDWAGAPGAALANAVREVADHFSHMPSDGTAPAWRIEGWANVNRGGQANQLHYHPAAFWSAVFYIDDGGIDGGGALGGALEFLDPRGPLPLMYAPDVRIVIEGCASAGLSEEYYPKTGALVMFPAWLGHRVTPYRGERVRISVAMNFMVPGS